MKKEKCNTFFRYCLFVVVVLDWNSNNRHQKRRGLKNPKVVVVDFVVDFVVVVDLEMTMIVDLEEVLMILEIMQLMMVVVDDLQHQ